ncbi:TetR/AcrR family transcriptional regulator [Nisaea acidiphila]|uniref:TetR/AcrR family transcriptional regulator n=1 Tax=Nisaea acidiphila TaxID=1862145 RepID=A0A9J7AXU4_9PROT|nr:TetR/AcrR family transcriptional regulator [Nisaea acidiphila]UUX51257.1 TetR/AcrR family transcriptional regulator [Nisaea acidiphila]
MASDENDAILDAALAVAGEKGWRAMDLHDVAERADLPAADLERRYRTKRALLDAIADRFDREAIAAIDPDADDPDLPAPERLFDALMTRIELLQENRPGYVALLKAACSDPCMALGGAPRLHSAMGDVLHRSGLGARGPFGCIRRKVLGALYLSVLKVWMEDESDDLGPTMSTLDGRLRRLDEFVASIPSGR